MPGKPLVAVIIFLGVYPQFVLDRSEKSTTTALHGGAFYGQASTGWTRYGPVSEAPSP